METLTHHAVTRMQQRGIKPYTVEMLFLCGAKAHDHRGGAILYFDKRARQRLRTQYSVEKFRRIEPQLDAYAVIAESGAVVTVGYRTRRINRS
jgi:hypothetical protein